MQISVFSVLFSPCLAIERSSRSLPTLEIRVNSTKRMPSTGDATAAKLFQLFPGHVDFGL